MKYQKIDSLCTYCGVGCEIVAHVDSNSIKSITALPNGPSSGGRLCVKGKDGHGFLQSQKRLKGSLVKHDFLKKNAKLFASLQPQLDSLTPLDKEFLHIPHALAVKLATLKLQEIKNKFSGDATAFLGGARTSCESGWLLQRFCREVMESPHIDNCARVCHSPSLAGLKETLGEGAATNPFDDILDAEFLLVIGSNTTEAHPIVANRILDSVKNGAGLAVVDIREIQLSKKANFHLSIPPESNLLFLNCIAHVIITEKLYDKEFIKKRVKGFEAYRDAILSDPLADPSIFEKLSGYENLANKIKEIARIYAKSRSMILWGLGITEHIDGSKAVAAIAALALLSGNVGKKGAGLMPLRGQNNVQGTCDVGCLPYYDPGYKKPKRDGLKTPQMVEAIEEGSLKSLWVMGEDITHIHTNQNRLHAAMERLEMLVVQEVMSCDVTQHADIIFGVKSGYEKKGVFVNAERRLHLSQPLINCELPDDWEILTLAANELGSGWSYKNSEDVWSDVTQSVEIFSGASYESISLNNQGQQWPIDKNGDTPRLHLKNFRTEDGFGYLKYYAYEMRGFVAALLNGNKPPFTLSTGRTLVHYNNSSQTRSCERLLAAYPQDIVLVSHEDAKRLDQSKNYRLVSKYGQSAPLKIKENKGMKPCVVFATFHFKESEINRVFGDEADEKTMTTRFKAVEVELREA